MDPVYGDINRVLIMFHKANTLLAGLTLIKKNGKSHFVAGSIEVPALIKKTLNPIKGFLL